MDTRWQTALGVCGLGAAKLALVEVDMCGRMLISDLKLQLDACVKSRMSVLVVIVTLGTDDFGALDHLDHVLSLRDEYLKKGLCFAVHADVCRAGYLTSVLRKDYAVLDNYEPPGMSFLFIIPVFKLNY